MATEFDLIERYFAAPRPPVEGHVRRGIGDDCAIACACRPVTSSRSRSIRSTPASTSPPTATRPTSAGRRSPAA
ncbi:MAG: hypothetical protein U5K43_06815 [Halofilum sp. (in: g-proteobacteria)]|nr:hypothetical protein [Halofilum sp. (in: g-proteobacteria)]